MLKTTEHNCFNQPTDELENDDISNWCLAALFHDLGYMLETYRAICEMGKGFSSDHVKEMLEALEKDLSRSTLDMNIDAQLHGLRSRTRTRWREREGGQLLH